MSTSPSETRWPNLTVFPARVGDSTLEEIAIQIRRRTEDNGTPGAFVGMRVVVYDCPSISWQGIRDVLAKNAAKSPSRWAHGQVVQLKCYYGWQMTVDEHLKRVLRGDLCSAKKLETKWAEHMTGGEESAAGRRRRRGRLVAANEGDDDTGIPTSWRRRRRGTSCAIM